MLLSLIGGLLPLAAQTDTLCQSNPVGNYHVVGQAGSTFFWNTQGQGLLLSGQGNDSVVVNWNNGPGNYQLSVTETSSEGCVGLPVILNILILDPNVSLNGPPICAPDLLTYSFTITVDASNVTASAGTLTNTSGNTWLVSGVPSGTDVLISVSSGACLETITVNAPNCACPPISPPIGNNLAYCVGDPVPILNADALPGFVVDWYSVASGGTAVLSGSNSFAPGSNGTWYAESRDPSTGCVSSQRTALSITENALPLVTVSSNTSICLGESVPLVANGAQTYSWLPVVNLSPATGNNVMASPTVTTTYTVTGTDANGCQNDAQVAVSVNPVYASTVNATVCAGSTYTLPDGSEVSSSNTYPVTLSSINGCDSVITTILTVNPVANGIQTVNTCGPYTWIDGITYTTSTNTPVFTIENGSINGCDSLVTLHLTIGTFASGIDVQAACGSYVWINGITYSASTNSPTFTIPGGSALGCDSVVTLNLTIDYLNFETDSVVACGSYTWINGTTYTTSTNTPSTVLMSNNPGECDTIVGLVLTILQPVNTTQNISICPGQSATLPDGSVVNTAGVYPITLTASNGCDSTITTTVTAIQASNQTVNAQICTGSNYTLPDGSSVNTAGSYQVTLDNALGCDSVITTNLTVVDAITVNIDTSICQGSNYTLPDGTVVTTAGTYLVTLQSSTGCDSVITTELQVSNVVTANIKASICAGESYVLPNGNSVNTAGSYPVTLSSVTGCDSIVTVFLGILPISTSSQSLTLCNGESYTLPGGTVVSSSGTYSDTLISATGCDSIISTQLTFLTPINTTINPHICENGNFVLPSGLSVNTAGIYTSTLTSAAGCDSVVTINLSVDTLVTLVLSADTSICRGSPAFLSASGGQNYLWLPSTGLSDSTLAQVTATPTSTTSYVVFTTNGQCSSQDTIVVTVLPGPDLQVVPSGGAICLGDSISLTASGADTYNWFSSDSSLVCDTCVSLVLSPDTTAQYTVQASVGVCSEQAIITVTVVPRVVASIVGDTALCLGETTVLTASGGTDYLWSTGDSLNPINLTPTSSEIVWVVTNNGVCSDTAYTSVLVYPVPVVDAGVDTTILFGGSVQLEASGSGALSWYPLQNLTCDDCLDPIASPPGTTEYCLTSINAYGCASVDCMVLTVDTLCAGLFIPNVFAPDDQGNPENNCFRLYGADCIGNMSLTIFNRWGEKVFVSANKDDCWDGSHHDKPLNTGVFVYYLEAELITGEKLSRQGNITLLR